MPWYWILLIVSVIVGPFDALYLYNKAWKKRQKRKAEEQLTAQEGSQAESTPPAGEDTERR